MTIKPVLALLLATTVSPDIASLARTFNDGKAVTYQVSALDKSRDLKLESKLTLTVTGKTTDGKTQVYVKSPAVTMSMGGSVAFEDPLDSKLDRKSVV